jgi:predicted acylesterase/phospholipase RssA
MQKYDDGISQLYEVYHKWSGSLWSYLFEKLGIPGAVLTLILLGLFVYIFVRGLRRFVRVMMNSSVWFFRQFSWRYSVTALILFAVYMSLMPFLIYPVFQGPSMPLYWDKTRIGVSVIKNVPFLSLRSFVIISATVLGVITITGVLSVALSNAAWLYDRWLERFSKFSSLEAVPIAPNEEGLPVQDDPLRNYERIGIILAGGGAKGAYQAGALKAIYDFIGDCRAHHKVKMIAATSIGSWNALFWLANLMTGADGGKGPLQKWWEGIGLKKVIQPTTYVPFYKDYLFSPKPWKRGFEAIFVQGRVAEELNKLLPESDTPRGIHFYFTRTNIRSGTLECVTNNPHACQRAASASLHDVKFFHQAKGIEDVRDGVFTSMALPLVFEPVRVQGEGCEDQYYEDGGVIDNLPVWFGTELEECDLLFILPLNASFEREVARGSLFKRLLRALDIRQGVLERGSLRTVGLYNKLTRLQNALNDCGRMLSGLQTKLDAEDQRKVSEIISLLDMHGASCVTPKKEVDIFAICPGKSGQDSKPLIGTMEFWKSKEASRAFMIMEAATKLELKKFSQIPDRNNVLILVGEKGVAYKPYGV